MIKNKRLLNGFTLIELLVSAVIVSILSMTAWYAQNSLLQANEISRNSITAVNLQRKSQEEVRRVAQAGGNYDNIGIGLCNFQPGNTCGFEDITASWPGFSRTLTVVSIGNSPEFKQVNVNVSWNDFGRVRSLDSVVFLSRPPWSLPGNLIGKVTDAGGNNIAGVVIVAKKVSTPDTFQTLSSLADIPRTDGKQVNYTFTDTGGQFQMVSGDWNLEASCSGYLNYTRPFPVTISVNADTQVNFSMIAAPVNGKITVIWPTAQPYSPQQGGTVGLYKNGLLIMQSPVNFVGSYTFPITFTDPQAQSFTVATLPTMYKNGFAGNFSCSAFPISQDPRGWSSAIVREDDSLACANPWIGSMGSDRISVLPGQTVVVPIPVVPVATATVTGTVRNQNGQAIAGANLVIRWQDNGNYPWPGKAVVTTNAAGVYTATVPAEQSLFTNVVGNYLRMSATISLPRELCCGTAGNMTASSSVIRVGPLTAGVNLGQDFAINTTSPAPQLCGGANGNVRDASSLGSLVGVRVQISGQANTDASGAYQFQCPDTTPFSLPAASYALIATKASYYQFTTQGNNYYSKVASGTVVVGANVTSAMPLVSLWPQGYGDIDIKVVRAGTSSVIQGATVKLAGPSSPANIVTNAGGHAVFYHALETWPVPQVLGNANYNQTAREYVITVTHPSYETAIVGNVKLNSTQTVVPTIELISRPGS